MQTTTQTRTKKRSTSNRTVTRLQIRGSGYKSYLTNRVRHQTVQVRRPGARYPLFDFCWEEAKKVGLIPDMPPTPIVSGHFESKWQDVTVTVELHK